MGINVRFKTVDENVDGHPKDCIFVNGIDLTPYVSKSIISSNSGDSLPKVILEILPDRLILDRSWSERFKDEEM